MKKIGTLTFHKSLNYGSFWQAFALQKYLKNKGYETEIIDFEPSGFKSLYDDFLPPTNKKNLIYDVIHLVLYKQIKDRKKSFRIASEKLLDLSEEKYTYQTGLADVDKRYTDIITGSDQIWNVLARDFDYSFMLNGVKNVNKIAYAVSINKGMCFEGENEDVIRNCLEDYSYLSVREEDGKKYLDDFLKLSKPVKVLVDPTFLIERSIYDTLAGDRRIKESYIFLFSIHFNSSVIEAAKKLSKRTGLPVYTLFSGRGTKNSIKVKKYFNMLTGNVGPECFLNLIKYADYVVADSFHGTAFSIIFQKKFYAIRNKARDVRINSILTLLGLDSHYINTSDFGNLNIDESIDYESVAQKKMELVKKSDAFFDMALEGIQ